jgi:hypothetical protein
MHGCAFGPAGGAAVCGFLIFGGLLAFLLAAAAILTRRK